jgi:2-polyprenyl-3-methyl-5-hydroxy-6-metoxy-1,4-benzoquinol methylase
MTAQKDLDEAKAEAFAGRMLEAINGASIVALASIGRHTGLFDTMAQLPPSTSTEIARAAGLHERYVREWLGGMVLGRIVEYDPATGRYVLPAEHGAFLTTAAGPNDLTAIAQIFPYAGLIQTELVDCFRNGGGVPYSSFPNFQSVQASTTGAFFETSLIDRVLPLADGLVERLQSGARVLDIGCGAGKAVNIMAGAFPASQFAGYDFSAEGIGLAQGEAASRGLTNARFEVKDIAEFDEPNTYDLITAIELIHDLAKPAKVLSNVHRSLKPGGILLAVDIAASSRLEENFDHPIGPTLFALSVLHCMTVSLAQGGEGLGTAVGEQKVSQLIRDAGFDSVEVKHLEGDFFYAYYVARKA